MNTYPKTIRLLGKDAAMHGDGKLAHYAMERWSMRAVVDQFPEFATGYLTFGNTRIAVTTGPDARCVARYLSVVAEARVKELAEWLEEIGRD